MTEILQYNTVGGRWENKNAGAATYPYVAVVQCGSLPFRADPVWCRGQGGVNFGNHVGYGPGNATPWFRDYRIGNTDWLGYQGHIAGFNAGTNGLFHLTLGWRQGAHGDPHARIEIGTSGQAYSSNWFVLTQPDNYTMDVVARINITSWHPIWVRLNNGRTMDYTGPCLTVRQLRM